MRSREPGQGAGPDPKSRHLWARSLLVWERNSPPIPRSSSLGAGNWPGPAPSAPPPAPTSLPRRAQPATRKHLGTTPPLAPLRWPRYLEREGKVPSRVATVVHPERPCGLLVPEVPERRPRARGGGRGVGPCSLAPGNGSREGFLSSWNPADVFAPERERERCELATNFGSVCSQKAIICSPVCWSVSPVHSHRVKPCSLPGQDPGDREAWRGEALDVRLRVLILSPSCPDAH